MAPLAVGAHVAMSPVSYALAKNRGWSQQEALVVAAKTALVGTVALIESGLARAPSEDSTSNLS